MRIMRLVCLLFLLAGSSTMAQERVYHVGVNGLSCPFCAYGIEKQLRQLDGVEQARTRLEQGVVVITMEGEASLSEARAASAVKKAGFTLRSFEQASQGTTDENSS